MDPPCTGRASMDSKSPTPPPRGGLIEAGPGTLPIAVSGFRRASESLGRAAQSSIAATQTGAADPDRDVRAWTPSAQRPALASAKAKPPRTTHAVDRRTIDSPPAEPCFRLSRYPLLGSSLETPLEPPLEPPLEVDPRIDLDSLYPRRSPHRRDGGFLVLCAPDARAGSHRSRHEPGTSIQSGAVARSDQSRMSRNSSIVRLST